MGKGFIIPIFFIFIVIFGIFAISRVLEVRKAHATFENYYAFRGCIQLVQRTNTYGICKTSDGKTIKMVLYKGKWYLDGDLPVCYQNFCW